MEPDRWSEIERIYHSVREQSPSGRAAFLEQVCGGDQELRREVASLLNHADGGEEYLEAAMMEVAANASDLPTIPASRNLGETAGAVIDRYRLVKKIGEGGMGEVWLAEQEQPVRRSVALKLIKAGMNTREVIARFESERQALALMDHPAIAKVFDAGSTPQGTPFFVMEHVAGIPITTYCDSHRLRTRERLELFISVCEGVQHAHQKAIIHRDLKPSNILVVEVDGRASPKIIDFGIAKALTRNLTADTTFTRAGALVGTPEYMSPEQATTSSEVIDTRTDVYSLGVIFYELLTGVRPLELGKTAFDEFLHRLREEEPAKPSTRICTQDATTSSEVARKRQTEPQVLAKQIRGDLDSIALKALEKDQSRRYGSPSDFAADIDRYLNSEPVLAVPPSALYRVGKLARRYRVALATIAAFVMVLIIAAGVSIRQSVRANREAAVAQAVNDFLQNDLLAQAGVGNQSGLNTTPDRDLKVRTALDRAAVRLTGKFDRQPEVEAAIRHTIGTTYLDLGLFSEARMQYERALVLERRALGPENPQTLRTITGIGAIAVKQGKYSEAEALLIRNLEIERRVLGSDNRYVLNSMDNLATAYALRGKYAQAEPLFNQELEIRLRVLGPEDRGTIMTMNNVANIYRREEKYAQAEVLYRQALEVGRRVLGPEHPYNLAPMSNLAIAFYQQGKYAQAEALARQTLEIKQRVLSPEHPATLNSMGNLVQVYYAQGKYARAEALATQTFEIRRRVLGSEHPDTLDVLSDLAKVYCAQGKYAQAEALNSQIVGIQGRVLGPEHRDTLGSIENLAVTYSAKGNYSRAETLFMQSLERERRVLGPETPEVLNNLSHIAAMYQRQGKYTLAETYAAEAVAGRRHLTGPEFVGVDSPADLAIAYQSQGKFAQAEHVAREAVEHDRKERPDDWLRYRAESLLGASLAGQKKYSEAEPLLLEGYRGMLERKDRIAIPDRYYLDGAHKWLIQFYQGVGKPKEAAEWRKR